MYVRTYVCMFVCTCMYVTTAPMSRKLKNIWNSISASKHDRKHSRRTNSKQPFYSGGASQHSISCRTDSGHALEQQLHRPQSTWTAMTMQPPTHPSTESPGRPGATHPEAEEVSAQQSTSSKPKRTKQHVHRPSHGIWARNGALPPVPPPSAAGATCPAVLAWDTREARIAADKAPGLPATARWQRPGCCSPPASAPTIVPCCPGRWPRSPPFSRVPNWNTALSLPARLLLWSRRAGLDAWKWESCTERSSQCAARPNDECTQLKVGKDRNNKHLSMVKCGFNI